MRFDHSNFHPRSLPQRDFGADVVENVSVNFNLSVLHYRLTYFPVYFYSYEFEFVPTSPFRHFLLLEGRSTNSSSTDRTARAKVRDLMVLE